MTIAGWIIMIGATTSITAFLGWCIYKVVSTPESTRHMHAPIEIDTHDK